MMSAIGSPRRYLQEQNRRYGQILQRVPEQDWPPLTAPYRPVEVWRSRRFLVMVYNQHDYERLSILRTELDAVGRYVDGVSWDELQRLKVECGRGDCWCVEVFPPEQEVVNIQNMRHLFGLKEPPEFGWKKER